MAKKPVSFSMDAEMKDELDLMSKRGGFRSTSDLLRTLVEKHLDLVVNNGEYVPIILRIPADKTSSRQELMDWFQVRVKGIVDRFCPEKS